MVIIIIIIIIMIIIIMIIVIVIMIIIIIIIMIIMIIMIMIIILEARAGADALHRGGVLEATLGQRPEFRPELEGSASVCASGAVGAWPLEAYGQPLFTYFAGDFLLAHRRAWAEIGGFLELGFTGGVDHAAACALRAAGLELVALQPPCVVLHQHHPRAPHDELHGRAAVAPDALCAHAAAAAGGGASGARLHGPPEYGRSCDYREQVAIIAYSSQL